MTNIHVNVHLRPEDAISIECAGHTWMRLGECVIHADLADLARIRDAIDTHMVSVEGEPEAEAQLCAHCLATFGEDDGDFDGHGDWSCAECAEANSYDMAAEHGTYRAAGGRVVG